LRRRYEALKGKLDYKNNGRKFFWYSSDIAYLQTLFEKQVSNRISSFLVEFSFSDIERSICLLLKTTKYFNEVHM